MRLERATRTAVSVTVLPSEAFISYINPWINRLHKRCLLRPLLRCLATLSDHQWLVTVTPSRAFFYGTIAIIRYIHKAKAVGPHAWAAKARAPWHRDTSACRDHLYSVISESATIHCRFVDRCAPRCVKPGTDKGRGYLHRMFFAT